VKALVRKTNQSLFAANEATRKIFEKLPQHEMLIEFKSPNQRTNKQNDSIHLYCERIATAANDAGFEMVLSSQVLNADVSIPWTKQLVKDHIWRKVQLAKYPGIQSTTKLQKNQVSEIAEIITRHLGENRGLSIPFPSDDK